jgi:hypothetical protein
MLKPRTMAFAVFEIVYLVAFVPAAAGFAVSLGHLVLVGSEDFADFAVSLGRLVLVGSENFAALYRFSCWQNRSNVAAAFPYVGLALAACDSAADLAVAVAAAAAADSAIDFAVVAHHSIVAAEDSAVKMLLNRLLGHFLEIAGWSSAGLADLVVLADFVDLPLIAAADFDVRKSFHSYLPPDPVDHRSSFAHCSRPG